MQEVRQYQIQNRYQDSGWEQTNESFADKYEANRFAFECSKRPVVYGMVRVVDTLADKVVVEYGAGHGQSRPIIDLDFKATIEHATQEVSTWPAWKQGCLGGTPARDHISPNGAEPDSVVHDAEKWLLSKGGKIPISGKFPHMFQGMLDDYSDQRPRDAQH